MKKVRVLANYNIADLDLLKGRQYCIDEKIAEKFAKIKMMYMKKPMLTIIEEVKEAVKKEVKAPKAKKEVKKD